MTNESESVNEIVEETRAASSRRRVRRMMILGIVLVLALGPYLFFRATSFGERVRVLRVASNPPGDRKKVEQIRVAVWNIAHGRGLAGSNWQEKPRPKVRRIMEIANKIREFNADIVVLNEVDFSATWSGGFDQAEAIAAEAGFPFYARQCNLDFGFLYGRWKFGNVVLSRFPITSARAVDLPPFREWEDWLAGRKRGLHCTIELDGSQTVEVIGVHFESRSEDSRVQSAKHISEYISNIEGPLVVAGDLNTTPTGTPHSGETADGENAFDVLKSSTRLQSGLTGIPQANQMTFPAASPTKTIDWILYCPAWFGGHDHAVWPTELSDHRPVSITLKLKTGVVAGD